TPLMLEAGGTILIDRGFVPEVNEDPATRPDGQLQGPVTVTGVLRHSQQASMFTPEPDVGRRLWFVRDSEQMAAGLGVSAVAPAMIEADATPNPGGLPIGGQTVVDFPNNHLAYAWTWFGLALTLAAIYLIYHQSHDRLRFR